MKMIPLTQGQVALVDDDDFERVNAFKWHAAYSKKVRSFYAQRCTKNKGKNKTVLLHRFIIGEPRGMDVDHRNGITLDCRKQNLRVATHIQNCQNRGKTIANTSGFKGVYWDPPSRKWYAQIQSQPLGRFIIAVDAARAYDHAARLYHGSFARLNFPGPGEAAALDVVPKPDQGEFIFLERSSMSPKP